MSDWKDLKKRASNRWQLPLLGVSVVLLGHAALRLRPAAVELPFDQAIAYLTRQVQAGVYEDAITLGNVLLTREKYDDGQRALVHHQLGRAWYDRARMQKITTSDMGVRIQDHFGEAIKRGQPLDAGDHVALGWALEWRHRYPQALDYFAQAIDVGVPEPFELRHHMLWLRLTKLKEPLATMGSALDTFLADVGERRLDLRLWAIERKLELFDDEGAIEAASTLLTRNEHFFNNTALNNRFAYRKAWLLYREGHYDEAEAQLRTIRNRVSESDEVHAMSGWLLGRVVLGVDGPQRPLEALSFFMDVVERHGSSPYAVASRIGAGEALGSLERHAESVASFRIAIEDLNKVSDERLVNRKALQTTLAVSGEIHRRSGRLPEAIEYTRLAVDLIDPSDVEQSSEFLQQLGQVQIELAEQVEAQALLQPRSGEEWSIEAITKEGRRLFSEAGATFLILAQLNTFHTTHGATASWRAAEVFAQAGERERAVRLYKAFAKERPDHSFVPRAQLRIGQISELSGDLVGAVEAYRECYRRFPRTLDGARALVPLARCYLALGPGFEELAHKTLLIVLEESEVFTPDAPEFADAMFLYGDGLDRTSDYNRAIASLEEALERYPDDPRATRARYLLADAYRKSGLSLKGSVAVARSPGEIEQTRAESTARFQEARRLYRELIEEYEQRAPADLHRLERMYRRHAYLYEADCYFEVGEYHRALKLYEEAAGLFKDTPSALAAYIQIINCQVFLGQPQEARAALARAQVLVDAIPEEALTSTVSPETREDWKHYLAWLDASELF